MLETKNRKKIGGSIINMSSQMGHVGGPIRSVYNMTKFGLEGLTKGMAIDLAKDNIRVNAICPGSVRTRATDRHIKSLGLNPDEAYKEFAQDALMKRMGRPEEIAAGALFLGTRDSSFMTGAHLVIDGGASID